MTSAEREALRLAVDAARRKVVGAELEPWHGTIGGYTNHSCKCARCRLAWREYQRPRMYRPRWRKCACGCGSFRQQTSRQRWATTRCRQRAWKRARALAAD